MCLLALLLFAPAAAATAQSIPVDFELGYRFVDVSGNEGMYRSQLNERQGFLLRSLNYASEGPFGALDFIRLEAEDLGAGPAGFLRFAAGRTETFRLDFTWRRADLYSALPAFANPFSKEGIVPGQHTYNRTRDIFDVNLQLLPGKAITPILGFTRNLYRGPGTTTYHLGGDEFALDEALRAKDDEYRIGLGFDVGPVQGAVTQGWRQYAWTNSVSLRPGAGEGNVSFPILGQDVHADLLDRNSRDKAHTPVTSAWVTARLLDRIKLIGSYVRADARGDTSSAETDAGAFVSFEISRFFAGLDETVSARARTDYWRGSARAEIQLMPGVDVTGGWTERSRTLEGTALATSLFLDAVTFGGVSVGDLLQIARSDTSLDRDERTFDASISARVLGPVSVNGGWSQTRQDVTFGGDLSSIIEEGSAPGEFRRTVNTYGGGASFSRAGLVLSADYRRDEADRPILRSDYVNRDRYKLRAGWSWKDLVRIGGTWRETHANDDVSDVGFSTRVREVTADLEVSVLKNLLSVRASAGEFKADRKILILQPQDFTVVPTAQRELGHTWEGGVTANWSVVSLDAAYLWMTNDGSIPFTVDRARLRAEAFVTPNIAVAGEWSWDKYNEKTAVDQAGVLANFSADRYYVGLHWKP